MPERKGSGIETPVEKVAVGGPNLSAPTKVYPGSSKIGRSDMGKGHSATVEGPAKCNKNDCSIQEKG